MRASGVLVVALAIPLGLAFAQPALPPDGTGSAAEPGSAGSVDPTLGSASGSAAGSAAAVDPVPPAVPAPPPPADDTPAGITFAGSLQLDYLLVPSDRDARSRVFDGATAEISLKATRELGRNATASVKVCFACHGFEVGLGMVELRATSALRVRIGRFTPAFGSFPARHDPANHLTSAAYFGRAAMMDWSISRRIMAPIGKMSPRLICPNGR